MRVARAVHGPHLSGDLAPHLAAAAAVSNQGALADSGHKVCRLACANMPSNNTHAAPLVSAAT